MDKTRELGSHVCLDPNRVPSCIFTTHNIRDVMRKIVRWKTKHKVRGAGKIREEPNS